ncbi:uncharacterized protein B0I36DRAFT_320178 [Microdochium trichocladiopsis]|uniref:Methyltransferase domain-containing protein n=1 Tax=Microdochium trichocladiopsis TaxID=1682393 RepID=A0A9P8Y8W3_9PEZI|nr:uncharacterized protein B0I36DRAFT_320178 [Microdochium trichocladiopsis]KAH7032856.1 hypothetical protein B0I36DRAFT_320178 [Microdochium trichocladiopsis]
MPSLFPSTDIPPFLRHINRCLVPGGSLHLTLIDPQPISSKTGPKPSGTFPAWLAVGRLRGKGSSIATVSVPAVPQSIRHEEEGHLVTVKEELRCLTARMLWQDVWGPFVKAERWWWDDHAIVQECVEFGTRWEYSHIIAVKETR